MKIRLSYLLLLLSFLPVWGQGQSLNLLGNLTGQYHLMQVTRTGKVLRNPWLGGFNLPQFSFLETDGSGSEDIMVYDRATMRAYQFKKTPTSVIQFQGKYYSLEGVFDNDSTFLLDWALFRDYDQDGLMDVFAGTNGTVRRYRGISMGLETGQFQLVDTVVKTDNGLGPIPLFVAQSDIPAILDVDGDGDLDVLTFDSGGSYVEFHKNLSVENTGLIDGMILVRADACWGKFFESGLSNQLTLNSTCKGGGSSVDPQSTTVHAGSTVAAFDATGDGALEVFLGDLLYPSILMGHNAGTSTNALMDTVIYNYPPNSAAVNLHQFPAVYFGDVYEDGRTDMIVAPNATNISVNVDNVWYYENTGSGPAANFGLVTESFLVDGIIDVGSGSHPAFIDFNGDGLMDLVIGTYTRQITSSVKVAGLALYKQVSTGAGLPPNWELVDENWLNISTAFSPAIAGLAPAFGDMDGDGDQDLILGDSDGKVHYYRNDGTAGGPAAFVLAQAQFMGIDVGQSASPLIEDINLDGKPDLVIGEQAGNLNYFENIGSASAPSFSSTANTTTWGGVDVEPVCCSGNSSPYIFHDTNGEMGVPGKRHLLVGSESGRIFAYADLDAQLLNGTFVLDHNPAFLGMYGAGRTRRSTLAAVQFSGMPFHTWFMGHLSGGISTFWHPSILGVKAANPAVPMVNLWPNPSQGNAQLRRLSENTGEQLEWEVLDMAGRQCAKGILRAGETQDLATPGTAGVYFVRVQGGSGVQVIRWVIQP